MINPRNYEGRYADETEKSEIVKACSLIVKKTKQPYDYSVVFPSSTGRQREKS